MRPLQIAAMAPMAGVLLKGLGGLSPLDKTKRDFGGAALL